MRLRDVILIVIAGTLLLPRMPDAKVSTPSLYSFVLTNNAASPADLEVSYFGIRYAGAPVITEGQAKWKFGHYGRIVDCRIEPVITVTLGSAEASTWAIRKNATTDTTVSTAVTLNATTNSFACAAFTPITFTPTDSFEMKITHPTYATNPGFIFYDTTLVIQADSR